MPIKVIGWGKCTTTESKNSNSTTYNDLVENSTSLSVEEGQEQEALIEGGEAEARKKQPDKYILETKRRVGSPSEVQGELGFTDDAGTVRVDPELAGAVGVTLTDVSKNVKVEFDSTEGLVAVTTYKTKGKTDSNGKLTDVNFFTKNAGTFSAVANTTGKNPKTEGWFIKNGDVYIPSLDTSPVSGVTYYELAAS